MWRTRPVFISSTFADMQFERDFLRTRVFPALEERLRERREHVEWVDLRVGIATASLQDEKEQHLRVLKVCLAEVRRCRPFMIVLIGDRYGWVAPEDRVHAAAREENVTFGDVARRSVTDLEIDFGILSNREQQLRSYVYFRAPLNYADMPPEVARLYSEAYATDPDAPDRILRLAALKARIAQEMPLGRVRTYRAEWDEEHRCVGGLEEFGRRVLDDLVAELTADSAVDVARPWPQAERDALGEFIEDRARDFVGREPLLDTLAGIAAGAGPGPLGACVTGEPGSGKSALFGALHGRLKASDVCVLAHAAGASVRAASVDFMLRRWIGELAVLLGIAADTPDDLAADVIDATFASLLARAAATRRVVLLIDALDQFEPTTRAKFLTWLPRTLPAQVRLIATAIPGEASGTLREHSGIAMIPLAPIDAATARKIVAAICGRYHRTLEPAVIDALLAKRGDAGPASGNPLWLLLATEDLNLLDADDFAKAGLYSGRGDEQLRAVMLAAVAAYPPDIGHLYHHLFERVEKHIGISATQAFLRLIAISRAGWRERDFAALFPRLTREPWNALKFAQLRRMFRGQLHRQGAPDQWNFNHAQMRAAVRLRLLREEAHERELHARVVDHLLSSLPDDDPVRESETMFHVIAAGVPTAATLYFGDSWLTENAETAASRTVADAVVAAGDPADAAVHFAHLILGPHPEDADVEDEERMRASRANAAHRLLLRVHDLIKGRVPLAAQQALLEAIEAALDRARLELPGESRPLRDLSICHTLTGDLLLQAGQHAQALQRYRRGLESADELLRRDPGDRLFRGMTALSLQRVGDALADMGQRVEALSFYRKSLTIGQELAALAPEVAVYKESQGLSLQKIGECLAASGASEEAASAFERSIEALEDVVAREPSLRDARAHLAQSYSDAGLNASAADADRALDLLRKSLALRERLAAADPQDMALQRETAIAQTLVGDALQRCGRRAEAIDAYRHSHATFERIAASDAANLRWQHDLALGCMHLGAALIAAGHTRDGTSLLCRAVDIGEALVKVDPANPGWVSGLVEAYRMLSEILRALVRLEEADAMQKRSGALRSAQTGAEPS